MADQKLVMTVLSAADVPARWPETRGHVLGMGGLNPNNQLTGRRVVSHTVTPLDDGQLLVTFVVEPG